MLSKPWSLVDACLCIVLGTNAIGTAAIIVVDDDGAGDYVTIQEAIDAAVDGDTILVLEGTYIEDLRVDKSVIIVSASGASDTFIFPATTGPGSGPGPQFDTATHCLLIQANDVTIEGFTIDGDNTLLPNNPDARSGILVDSRQGAVAGLTVRECLIQNMAYRGVYALGIDAPCEIAHCTIDAIHTQPGESAGIAIENAEVQVSNNAISSCVLGILFDNASQGFATANTLSTDVTGVMVRENAGIITISANRAIGCPTGFRTSSNPFDVVISQNSSLACQLGIQVMGGLAPSAAIDVVGNHLDGTSDPESLGIEVTSEIHGGGDGDTRSLIRRNAIIHNGRAIALREVDASTEVDVLIGGAPQETNHFYNTRSTMLDLVGCNDAVHATHNFWGTTDLSTIETLVIHKIDDTSLGLVDFSSPVDESPYLHTTGTPRIGDTITLSLHAFYGQVFFMMFSVDTAQIPFPPFGTLLLDPSFLRLLLSGSIPSGGTLNFDATIPDDDALVGITLYFQALIGFDLGNGDGSLSNATSMTFES